MQTNPQNIQRAIKDRARELGFEDCRFTSAAPPSSKQLFLEWIEEGCQAGMHWMEREHSLQRRCDLQQILPGIKTVICLAKSYYTPDPDPSTVQAHVARYARVMDYHKTLTTPLKQLANYIDSISGPDTHSLFYADTGSILERDLAQRAGIGFIGKHHNLVSRHLGNWFFLAEILTTLELPLDPPARNHCGTCHRCIDSCPTGALSDAKHLDARKCLSYLTIELRGSIPEPFHAAMGSRFFGCDRCLEACPWNRFAQPTTLPLAFVLNTPFQTFLTQVEAMDEQTFSTIFAKTALLRAKQPGILRNLRIVLQNNMPDGPTSPSQQMS